MLRTALVAALWSSTAMAQVQILPAPSCRSCRISWTPVTVIDGAAGHLSGYPPSVYRAQDGTVVLVDVAERLPIVFHADGTYFKTIGRKGAGPGEYSFARVVTGGSDGSLHILDPVLARHTVIRPDGKLTSVPLPGSGPGLASAVLLPSGSIVTNQISRDSAGVGVPLQEYDSTGRLLRRFGVNETYSFNEPWRVERALSARSDGSVLALNAYANTLEQYDTRGELAATYIRRAPWLNGSDPNREPSGGYADKRPSVVGKAVWEDSAGFVWIATLVPAPNWKPVTPGSEIPAPQDRFSTVVEVIDLQKRQVVAVDTMPHMVVGLANKGYIATYDEKPDGTPVVHVWKLNLLRGGNGK